MSNSARERWRELLRTWNVDEGRADWQFEEIVRAYAEPGRLYHTLEHVLAMLDTVDELSAHADHLNAVRLAAWLHDVIYDSKSTDNEERSAVYAAELCKDLAIPIGGRVAELIRKTKTHDAGDDADAKILLDADLAILGATPSTYDAYAASIRREYAWALDAHYVEGRRRVLEQFLSRPQIYHLLQHLEATARKNLAREIAGLGG